MDINKEDFCKPSILGVNRHSIRCGCSCHGDSNIKHITPCCNSGYIEVYEYVEESKKLLDRFFNK